MVVVTAEQGQVRGGAALGEGAPVAEGGWTLRTGYVLVLLTVMYTLNYADRSVFGLLLPLIKRDMQVSDTLLGLMSGFAFALFYALAGVPAAALADRWSRRKVIAIGLSLWSLMTVLTGFTQNVVQMMAARFLLGAGEAGGTAPSNAMVADMLDRSRRPLALGIQNCAPSLSMLLFFPVLGWVAQAHGWRTAFVVAGAPGLLLAALFIVTVKEPSQRPLESAPSPPRASFRQSLSALASSKAYVLLVICSVLKSFSLFGLQTWLPSFFTRVHHLSTTEVGGYMGVINGPAGIVGAVLGGLLTSSLIRRDVRWLAWSPAIIILLVVPSDLLLLYGGGAGWKIGLALDSFLQAAMAAPLFALAMSAADSRNRATATAVLLLFMYLFGQTTGPLFVGALSDHLRPQLGDAAIRYALTATILGPLLGGLVLLRAGRHVARST